MSVNKELVKGSTSMLVLGVLEEKEMYGYQIIKELEQRSETVFSLKEVLKNRNHIFSPNMLSAIKKGSRRESRMIISSMQQVQSWLSI